MPSEGDVLTYTNGHQAFAPPEAGGGGLADGFGTSGETTQILGAAGGTGEPGASLIIAAGTGNDTPGTDAPYLSLAGNDSEGNAGAAEIGGASVRLAAADIRVGSLPTSDPGVAGQLYTTAGALMVSAG